MRAGLHNSSGLRRIWRVGLYYCPKCFRNTRRTIVGNCTKVRPGDCCGLKLIRGSEILDNPAIWADHASVTGLQPVETPTGY